MSESLTVNGWTVRFRFRTIKKKRKVNGKTRGRYEGKYVYLRITSPTHQVRDFYAGAGDVLAAAGGKSRGRTAIAAAPATSPAPRGRTGGQKPVRQEVAWDPAKEGGRRDPAKHRWTEREWESYTRDAVTAKRRAKRG